MAKNKKNDYFLLTEELAAFGVQASDLLLAVLSDYSADTLHEQRTKMHEIEHAADQVQHDIQNKLSAEFITPIDQEDILHLVQTMDDITDALDEILQEFYMYHIKEVTPDTLALVKVVNRCVKTLFEAVKKLKEFKKPDALRALLQEVSHIETEADGVYIEAVHTLFGREDIDSKTLFGIKDIYYSLENCCDLCEHATDVIEQIIIKNT